MASPVAVATPVGEESPGVEKAMSAYAGSNTATAEVIAPKPTSARQMRITVPPGVEPGSTITAMSPEGTSFSVCKST